jgi:hypothetical protein
MWDSSLANIGFTVREAAVDQVQNYCRTYVETSPFEEMFCMGVLRCERVSLADVQDFPTGEIFSSSYAEFIDADSPATVEFV